MEKTDANDLFAMLLNLKAAWAGVCGGTECNTRESAAVERMKRLAHDLHAAISHACGQGLTVRLFSPRGGGRTHVVRTVGEMNPDGITFQYATEAHADRTLHMCSLPAMTWIDSSSGTDTQPVCMN